MYQALVHWILRYANLLPVTFVSATMKILWKSRWNLPRRKGLVNESGEVDSWKLSPKACQGLAHSKDMLCLANSNDTFHIWHIQWQCHVNHVAYPLYMVCLLRAGTGMKPTTIISQHDSLVSIRRLDEQFTSVKFLCYWFRSCLWSLISQYSNHKLLYYLPN